MGVGEAVNDTKKVSAAAVDLGLIAGQKPIVTRARKAISTFKVRENMRSAPRSRCARRGCTSSSTLVTSRCRACATSASRPEVVRRAGQLRDRRQGAHHLPEIDYDKVESMLGLDIVVCTTAKTDARRAPCCAPSTSRSGSERPGRSDAENGGPLNG